MEGETNHLINICFLLIIIENLIIFLNGTPECLKSPFYNNISTFDLGDVKHSNANGYQHDKKK